MKIVVHNRPSGYFTLNILQENCFHIFRPLIFGSSEPSKIYEFGKLVIRNYNRGFYNHAETQFEFRVNLNKYNSYSGFEHCQNNSVNFNLNPSGPNNNKDLLFKWMMGKDEDSKNLIMFHPELLNGEFYEDI